MKKENAAQKRDKLVKKEGSSAKKKLMVNLNPDQIQPMNLAMVDGGMGDSVMQPAKMMSLLDQIVDKSRPQIDAPPMPVELLPPH